MYRIVLGALALLGAAPLAAEVTQTTADGFVSRNEVTVAANARATWLELIKPADWWSSKHTWSGDAANLTLVPQAGGCFCERILGEDDGGGFSLDGSALHMTVIQAFPLKVLRLRGGLGPLQSEPADGILTITLKDVPGGTRVLFEYNVGGPMRYPIGEIAPAVDRVLAEQLAGLEDKLGKLETPDSSATDDEPVTQDAPDAVQPAG